MTINRLLTLIGFLAAALLCGCDNGTNADREVIVREGEPDYVITHDDELIEKAVAEAKKTLPDFDLALKTQAPQTGDFSVKKGFAYGEGSQEHIWCNNIVRTKDGYQAEINNDPVDATYLKLGQTVTIKPEEVSDWMYFENGEMRGGYTVVALVYGTEQQEQFQKMMNIDWDRYDFLKK